MGNKLRLKLNSSTGETRGLLRFASDKNIEKTSGRGIFLGDKGCKTSFFGTGKCRFNPRIPGVLALGVYQKLDINISISQC